jgi:polar amino acid transport system substrate-binding protein
MQSDFTYLVPADSSIRTVADVDQPGVRVAVARGDASDLHLSRSLKRAQLVRADTLAAALELVRARRAEARAAPRPVLTDESIRLPGSRILDDGFAAIFVAALVPKGHAGHLAYVSEFVEEAKSSGLVKQVIERNSLRGVRVAPAGNQKAQ